MCVCVCVWVCLCVVTYFHYTMHGRHRALQVAYTAHTHDWKIIRTNSNLMSVCPKWKQKAKLKTLQNAWFQASTSNWMIIALFWVITQRIAGISYRRFGKNFRFCLQSSRNPWPLMKRPIGCLETSVRNYHCVITQNSADFKLQNIWNRLIRELCICLFLKICLMKFIKFFREKC